MANSYMLEVGNSINPSMIRDLIFKDDPEIILDDERPGCFWAKFADSAMIAYFDIDKKMVSADEFRDDGWKLAASISFTPNNSCLAEAYRRIDELIEDLLQVSDCNLVLTWMFETTYAFRIDGVYKRAIPFPTDGAA